METLSASHPKRVSGYHSFRIMLQTAFLGTVVFLTFRNSDAVPGRALPEDLQDRPIAG